MLFDKPVCKSYFSSEALKNGVLIYIARSAGIILLVVLTITVSLLLTSVDYRLLTVV